MVNKTIWKKQSTEQSTVEKTIEIRNKVQNKVLLERIFKSQLCFQVDRQKVSISSGFYASANCMFFVTFAGTLCIKTMPERDVLRVQVYWTETKDLVNRKLCEDNANGRDVFFENVTGIYCSPSKPTKSCSCMCFINLKCR